MTAQPASKCQAGSTWFSQKPYFLLPLGVLVIYSLIASNSPELLIQADKIITPLVDALHYIGLGVTKPFMDGPMPERYYANLIGIGVWGVVAYNIRTLSWYATKGVNTRDPRQLWKRVQERYGLLVLGLAIVAAFLSIVLFASFLVLTFFNAIRGWLVLHVTDLVTPILNVIAWVFPGALITAFWWLIVWRLYRSFVSVYKYIRSTCQEEK